MSVVRLVSLAVSNVGPLPGRTDLGALDPRLTLICGRNEIGKSTLVAALRAALFERHKAGHAGIVALRPHQTRLAPEIEVTLSIGGEEVIVHKRFLEQPFAEVRIGGRIWNGTEADEELTRRLGAQAAGGRGIKTADMGLWGLLWVHQDDSAFTDPAERLDPTVRGALQESIGRQVGQVLGGRHGERLRVAVTERVAEFYTPRTGVPTGRLREAQDQVAALTTEVAAVETAMVAVEARSQERERVEAQLIEMARIGSTIEREVQVARAEVELAVAAESRLREFTSALVAATARAGELEGRQRERAALVHAVATDQSEATRLGELVSELSMGLARRMDTERDADVSLAGTEQRLSAARQAVETAGRVVDQRRRRTEREQLRDRRSKAAELAARKSMVDVALGTALTSEAWAGLRARSEAVRALRQRVEAQGTRIRVQSTMSGTTTEQSQVIARPTDVDVGGGVTLHVVPARVGLAHHVAEAHRTQAALDELLRSCAVPFLDAVRHARRARGEAEGVLARLAPQLEALAPEGVGALEAAVSRTQERVTALGSALERAQRSAAVCAGLQSQLASEPLRESTVAHLEAVSRELAVAHARHEAIATRVTVEARVPLEVGLDAEPRAPLAPGASQTWNLTETTTFWLGDVAHVLIEPGGEDQRLAGQRLDAASEALRTALAHAGVSSLEHARERAQRAADLGRDLQLERQRLTELAPRGPEALASEVADARRTLTESTERLAMAQGLAAQLAAARRVLETNAVTHELNERAESLAAAALTSKAAVDDRAVRVEVTRASDAGPQGRAVWLVSEPRVETLESGLTGGLTGGLTVELTPGELPDGVVQELAAAEAALATSLAEAHVADLEVAEQRWREGLVLAETRRGLEAQLAALTPDGDAELDTGAEAEPDEGDLPELAACEAAVAHERTVVAQHEAERDAAREVASHAKVARATAETELRENRARLEALTNRLNDARARLDAARQVCDDSVLTDLLAAERAQQAAAQRALHDAPPPALDSRAAAEEERRASDAVTTHRRKVGDLRLQRERLDTLLETAAISGHFERLSELRADLTEAQLRLAAFERDARAAKRLSDELQRAYDDAQRRFLLPVVEAAQPFLANLRPGTNLQMNADLKVDKLVRGGIAEEFTTLSGGTREQLAIIVRLALARVLAKDGKALPLILDDTMGWTDDDRFRRMIQILREASRELQIVILTCQPSRWEARLGAGKTIHLEAVRAGQ